MNKTKLLDLIMSLTDEDKELDMLEKIEDLEERIKVIELSLEKIYQYLIDEDGE